MFAQLRQVFSFPNPVNEVAARVVAGMVVVLSLAILLTGQWWLAFLLAYGFLARVATGPTLSPMGQLSTRLIAPRIAQPKLVPGAAQALCANGRPCLLAYGTRLALRRRPIGSCGRRRSPYSLSSPPSSHSWASAPAASSSTT